MADGFAIRNRGAHLPDHIRRLELISGPRSPRIAATHAAPPSATVDSSVASPHRVPGSPFRPLASQQFAQDVAARFENSATATASTTSFRSSSSFDAPRGDGSSSSVGSRKQAEHEDFANAFGNLSVWIDASVHKCAYHAGFDKIRLYALFLRCFLDELALPSATTIQRATQQLDAYVRYLSSNNDTSSTASMTSGSSQSQLQAKGTANSYVATIPRHPALRIDRLSPKANFQSAALVPELLSPRRAPSQSPRALRSSATAKPDDQHQPQQQDDQARSPKATATLRNTLSYPTRKKIVHMSDHEEHVLELVLYFEEVLRKRGGSQSPSKSSTAMAAKSPTKKKKSVRDSSNNSAVEFTTQWLLLTSDEKHRILRQRKKQLARHEFFPCSSAYSSVAESLVTSSNSKADECELKLISALVEARSTSAGGAPAGSGSNSSSSTHAHKMELASYFSLVVLCLHESIRRMAVFSLELADFAWKVLCDDALTLCEDMFATILSNQKQAQQQLRKLKLAKAELTQQIVDVESEIQRLQTQNMRSLTMCNLEKQEFLHLEREEQWHGHCKALIIGCVAQLQDSVNTPTWLHEQPIQTNRDHDSEEELSASRRLVASSREAGAQQDQHGRLGEYQRLAPGFAAFYFRNRFQVIYIAHLALLCRSYLHLHERRGVRDVMSSTSISSGGNDALDLQHPQTPGTAGATSGQLGEDSMSSFFLGAASLSNSNPMEKISLSELHTLREINDTLRAIEVLYAETGVSSGDAGTSERAEAATTAATSKPKLRRPRVLQRSFGTQFPEMGAGSARSFLRSLSYCTIAATTISSATLPSRSRAAATFLPAGTSAKLRAEIEAHHEKVLVTPIGSGRRRSSLRFKGVRETASQQQQQSQSRQQPQIRLSKAVLKLPRHIKELLVLPLVTAEGGESGDEAFPADDPVRSIATCMSKHEIIEKICWVYRSALDTAYASGTASHSSAGDLLPVSLAGAASSGGDHAAWTSESFVEFIYGAILEAESGNLERCEREFVRFFASVQLFLSNSASGSSGSSSGSSSSSTGGSGSSSSIASGSILFFALLAKLLHLQNELDEPTREKRSLPSRVFAVLFYCQRVLLHVAVSKKLIESSGFSLDVWTIMTQEDMSSWGVASPVVKPVPPTPASPSSKRVAASTTSASSSTPFVLLESVKALLLHIVSFAFASDVASLLEERYQFLFDKSVVATVSLLTPVTPGPYNLSSASSASGSSSSSSHVPNGQLAEVQILPMDLAVTTIVHCWVHVHFDVEHRLGLTLQGALSDNDGCLSFEEFVNVMAASGAHSSNNSSGGAGSHPASSSMISRARLAHIYAAAQRANAKSSLLGLSGTGEAPHWKQLLSAVVENVDILGMQERFLSVDFRSIQQALLAPGGGSSAHSPLGSFSLASWLLGSSSSASSSSQRQSSSTQTLIKSWQLHHKSMRDHIALAFQAESALDGVRCWQTGTLRLDRVQSLLHVAIHSEDTASGRASTRKLKKRRSAMNAGSGASDAASDKEGHAAAVGNAPPRTDDAPTQELEPDALSVAWKAYQLLQWDHARAHQFADQVRLKQQRMQKLTAATTTSSSMGTSVVSSGGSTGTAAAAASVAPRPPSPGKAEEIRPQRPPMPTKTAQRPHRP